MKEVKAYRCEYCGKMFIRKNSCEKHEKNDCSRNPINRALCYDCKYYHAGYRIDEEKDVELVRDDGIKFTKRMQQNRCKINNDLMFNPLHMPDYICDALIDAGWQYMPTVENGCGNYEHYKQ